MEAEPTPKGHRVTMTDRDSLWVHTGEGEIIHIFRGFNGVKLTLWANKGVKYTKKTLNGSIINLQPKSNY